MIEFKDYVMVRRDHYERLICLTISAYFHTEGTFYGGNHLAEEGLRAFLQELGEWRESFKSEKQKVTAPHYE